MHKEIFTLPPNPAEVPKKESQLDDNQARTRFYELLESLTPELQKRWEVQIESELDAKKTTYQEACKKLEAIRAERERILYHSYTPVTKGSYDWMEVPLGGQELNQTIDRLLSSKLEENLLGDGKVAKVYRVINTKNICVKVVENEESYREGNNVFQESQFLEDLSDFEVEGVRTPHFIQCFSGTRMNAIVMEEIHGESLEQLMNGDADFPENFSFDDFFGRLYKYLQALHQKNIFHLDIAARNVMVDRERGIPVVIDFGKSKHFDFSEEVKLEPSQDQAGFEALRAEVKAFLSGKGRYKRVLTKSGKSVINKSLSQ